MESKEFIEKYQSTGKESKELLQLKTLIVEDCSNVSQHERHFKSLEQHVKELVELYNIEPSITVPEHYSNNSKVDVISFTEEHLEGFKDALLFNIIKYVVRLGRKDDEDKEVEKICNYVERLKQHLIKEELINE